MVVLKSKKNVFWEALFVTIIIFVTGILLGFSLESSRLNQINNFYLQSEISLMDIFTFNNLIEMGADCNTLENQNILFADKIYGESKLLDQYEEVEKLSENTKITHQKYDLMRTLLWINVIKTKEQCKDSTNSVIYLYEFETEDLAQKATQKVWSRILLDLKETTGNNIILIPIAVNKEIYSLEALLNKYEINRYPVVIINDHVIENLESETKLQKYLN